MFSGIPENVYGKTHLIKEAKCTQPTYLIKGYVHNNIFNKTFNNFHLKYKETDVIKSSNRTYLTAENRKNKQ